MNISFDFGLDAVAQVDAIDDIGILKGWDSIKKKSKLVLCMPLEWRSVLHQTVKEKYPKFESTEMEYQAYRELAIEILYHRGIQALSLASIISKVPSRSENLKIFY
ncbi:hypothetical protein RF11_13553 [Thelohanellus kitauei]|uniref:Uncharacterized protein n=1 Tax=Thelohanellus kitauei TaxID=669202 RepID=A0A0C2MXN4_THEKT|nr:hypothetical protein RF11_13553 [Thelohanellus kitauei]